MTDDARLLETTINDMTGRDDIPEAMLVDILDFAYRARRAKPAWLDLLVADDGEMNRLNLRHLGKDTPTDVLAFDDGEDEDGRIRLGDVAIGAETAFREAGERGVPFEHELAFYALHGLLHLLGMDDGGDDERAEMHRVQAEIMREYGLELRGDW